MKRRRRFLLPKSWSPKSFKKSFKRTWLFMLSLSDRCSDRRTSSSCRVGGYLVSINFTEGSFVRKDNRGCSESWACACREERQPERGLPVEVQESTVAADIGKS